MNTNNVNQLKIHFGRSSDGTLLFAYYDSETDDGSPRTYTEHRRSYRPPYFACFYAYPNARPSWELVRDKNHKVESTITCFKGLSIGYGEPLPKSANALRDDLQPLIDKLSGYAIQNGYPIWSSYLSFIHTSKLCKQHANSMPEIDLVESKHFTLRINIVDGPVIDIKKLELSSKKRTPKRPREDTVDDVRDEQPRRRARVHALPALPIEDSFPPVPVPVPVADDQPLVVAVPGSNFLQPNEFSDSHHGFDEQVANEGADQRPHLQPVSEPPVDVTPNYSLELSLFDAEDNLPLSPPDLSCSPLFELSAGSSDPDDFFRDL